MIIRIEFKNPESTETKQTHTLFLNSLNATCLASSNAHMISSSKEMQEAVGDSVVFWYLEADILDKDYGGVKNCMNDLEKYPSVKRVDILPIEGHYDTFSGSSIELDTILMEGILKNYFNGV